MPSLSHDLRRLLEKTIGGENGARQIAEDGAERSLQRLAVDRHEPHTVLTPDERTLRNQLRAHGRQLGDKRDPQRGNQTITHLKQAVGYEHWHRMLFARFLAENDLLLHPEHGVALSLDEVKELALSEQRDWIELAADFAQRMLLSAVFRPDDPVLRVALPPEKRLELENKLNSLPHEVFLADDSLGWVYQYWQKDAKEKVNRSEVKIGADELAPVTQLFTDDYMVLFLLHNTLGAWWAAKRKAEGKSIALPGYEWTYLRLKDDGMPAAGSFGGWPKVARDLKVLDPSMGSGHFLTFALPILVGFRMEEEGLTRQKAVEAVLHDNLYGVEIDNRCTQIAAFNLAWTAWRMVGHRPLPRLNLACSGLGINAREEDWLKLAGGDNRVEETMRRLYHLFEQAPILASLIDPKRVAGNLFTAEFSRVQPLLLHALTSETEGEATNELAITAQGIVEAASVLCSDFTLVATNVPYLGRGKQNDTLRDFCDRFHGLAKADLATCFVQRCLEFCREGCTAAVVTPQNWLFMGGYKELRKDLLKRTSWTAVARLGEHAFESPQAAGAFPALIILNKQAPTEGQTFATIDAGEERSSAAKAAVLRNGEVSEQSQAGQLKVPDCRVTFGVSHSASLLQEHAGSYVGLQNGDSPRFILFFWEIPDQEGVWTFFQLPCDSTMFYGGRSGILRWEGGAGQLASFEGLFIKGREAWGRRGVAIRHMRELPATLYSGEMYDQSSAVIVPRDASMLPAIWEFCSSPSFNAAVRKLDQAIKVTNATLAKVPFDAAHWKKVAAAKCPKGLPKPTSGDPTQWLATGLPSDSDKPLQVAVAVLLGYRWPRQAGANFMDCVALPPSGLASHVDKDGIVPLTATQGGVSAADRIRAVLADAFGSKWSAAMLSQLLSEVGCSGMKLEVWLRDVFFEQHCELFYQRPFIWHVWDGLTDGFHALVNYHRLDRRNLEKLIYTYVGDWLARQRQDVVEGVEGADTRLAAAQHLQDELKEILRGECTKDKKSGYDIFARWKPLSAQPIGWEPDLNDGVRINIRPWITAARIYKATTPGILRVQPNIKYAKDRGKEPARDPKEFPWFKSSPDRVNDHHLSLEEKKAARGIQ